MDQFITIFSMFISVGVAIIGYMSHKLRSEIQEIHVMVNSRMEEALNRIDQLGEALKDEGIAVPAKPTSKEREKNGWAPRTVDEEEGDN